MRIDTALKIDNSSDFKPYLRSFNLVSVPEKIAISEITECCTRKSSKPHSPAGKAETNIGSDDQFSVDKTQNPFSH